ncbi:sensor histidine kinase, partial [Kineococcus glutinatus]|uniref:sensor histidine kinase n=1 Tax=Kineococcus glutinatus TaxID=1070872 RepID=UPI0031EBC3D7
MSSSLAPAVERPPATGTAGRFLRSWGDGWWAVCHLFLTPFLLGFHLAVVVVMIVGAALTPVLLTGLPLLVMSRWAARGLAAVERWRLWHLLGEWVPALPRSAPDPRPWWRQVLLDAQPWRTAVHLLLVSTWGMVASVLLASLLGVALAGVALPFVPHEGGLSLPYVSPGVALPVGEGAAAVTGLALLLVVPFLARTLALPEAASARVLLAPMRRTREAFLTARVETLTQTRERAVDSVEAERRRIERDLHDGPQQRLVSLAMQLGMAQRELERDPERARLLLDKAHASAKEAVTDMRQVARGIHPPVLTDRGLDAALSALAASCPVPVAVEVALEPGPAGRPAPTAEAIAYFCVSEALTNTAKHSGATRAR